jgi:outer membrane protein assembly factor BamB
MRESGISHLKYDMLSYPLRTVVLLLIVGTGWDTQAQEAQDHKALTFHRAPKPLSPDAVTEDWPTFLGPTHNGISNEKGLLKEWPEGGPSLIWEMQTGSGYSSPSIVGKKLVFFHRIDNQEIVECQEAATGIRYWRFSYPTDYEDRYGYSNGPRATPVLNEQHVYTLGAQGKLHCLNLETGEVVWKNNLAKNYCLVPGFFGIGTTPLIEGRLLIVNVGALEGPNVVAFDKTTGSIVWTAGNEWGASYASPVPAVVHGKKRIFVFAGGERRPPVGGLLCINPADGKIGFRFPWRSRTYESVNASCPVIIDNQVFVSATYKTGSALLNIQPDFTHSVAWKTKDIGLHFNTAIHKDGYLYGFDGRNKSDALLVCINVKTGEIVWQDVLEWKEQLEVQGRVRNLTLSPYRGSLLMVDNHFLCLGESGHLLWLDLSPKGSKILARTWLFTASETWTPPVISNGLLYITQNNKDVAHNTLPRLLCYDLRGKN